MRSLSRRTLLRGAGAAIALPVLDAMRPAFASAKKQAPVRMVFTYVPNGIIMKDWTPAGTGAQWELTRTLEPLSAVRQDVMVLTGLAQVNGRALGDGPGDHARAASTFLTGVHPKKTAGADISVGISVDQIAAQQVGGKTKFASLELGCEDGRMVGNCDSGYSCAYSNSISWRSPSTPMPPEVNPRAVFERMFEGFDAEETAAGRARREIYRRSILDSVLEDAGSLKATLGTTDRRKIDEYLHAIREIERRIEQAERDGKQIAPTIDKPAGVPVEYTEHVAVMFDLMAIALQADLTRVLTFMMGREGSNRTYREIGVPDPHHGISHHRGDAELIDKLAKINRFHMEQYARFLAKLKATPDGEGTLLDHTMLVYGSGLSDGNRHLHHDLPVLLAGHGGNIKPGRHVTYKSETPMNNLFLSMLDKMGVNTEKFGDATGKLEYLSDL